MGLKNVKNYDIKAEDLNINDFFEIGESYNKAMKLKAVGHHEIRAKLYRIICLLTSKINLGNDELARLMTEKTGKQWKIADIHEFAPNFDKQNKVSSLYAICETNPNFYPETNVCKLKPKTTEFNRVMAYDLTGIENTSDCSRLAFISCGDPQGPNYNRNYCELYNNTNWFWRYALKKYKLEDYNFRFKPIKYGGHIPNNEVGDIMFSVLDEYFINLNEKAKTSSPKEEEEG